MINIDQQGLVLVDFWAEWCGPCKMLSPIIDEIITENNNVKLVKVDVDAESDFAAKYNINSIPTVIIFENGKIKDTLVGLRNKNEYLKALGIS